MKRRILIQRLRRTCKSNLAKEWLQMKLIYPVIFTETRKNILFEVPDLGIVSEANGENKKKADMATAIGMARDAIGLYLMALEEKGEAFPPSCRISDIDISEGCFADAGESIISLVDIDPVAYKSIYDNKTVRCNVTIKRWMKRAADAMDLNLSGVLQDALLEQLQHTEYGKG